MKSYYTSTGWQGHNLTIQSNLKEFIVDLKTKGKWDTSPSNQKTGFMTRTNPPETRGEISWNQQNNQRRKLSTTETFEGFKKQPATAYSTATSRFCFFFFLLFVTTIATISIIFVKDSDKTAISGNVKDHDKTVIATTI